MTGLILGLVPELRACIACWSLQQFAIAPETLPRSFNDHGPLPQVKIEAVRAGSYADDLPKFYSTRVWVPPQHARGTCSRCRDREFDAQGPEHGPGSRGYSPRRRDRHTSLTCKVSRCEAVAPNALRAQCNAHTKRNRRNSDLVRRTSARDRNVGKW